MQKNSIHLLRTGYVRPCFFFLDNTIACSKCLKQADISRRSQGIYSPWKKIVTDSGVPINYHSLYLPYNTVLHNHSQKMLLVHPPELVMCIWISRQNIVQLMAIKFVGNNLFNKLCICWEIISNETRNSDNCYWYRCMAIRKLSMV